MRIYFKKYKVNLQKEGGPDHKIHAVTSNCVTSDAIKFQVAFEGPISEKCIVDTAGEILTSRGCIDRNCKTGHERLMRLVRRKRRVHRKRRVPCLLRVVRIQITRNTRKDYFPCSGRASLCKKCLSTILPPRYQ